MRLLALAPTPTFALLGRAVSRPGEQPAECDLLRGHHSSPLTGMVSMYLLMSVFHAGDRGFASWQPARGLQRPNSPSGIDALCRIGPASINRLALFHRLDRT